MPRLESGALKYAWKHQTQAVLNQSNPVSGTKYTVLDTTEDVRIYTIYSYVTWTVQPTPLELHCTIDGITETVSVTNPASDTGYYGWRNPGLATELAFDTNTYGYYLSHLLDAQSAKFELEITGGTVSALVGRIKYAKLLPT